MTLREFIRQNRTELDDLINRALNYVPRQASCNCHNSGTDHYHSEKQNLNDKERRLWILNDEGLYKWARSCGVKI